MRNFGLVACCSAALILPVAAAERKSGQRFAQPEAMPADRFAETHAPLLKPQESRRTSTLTEQVFPSRSGSKSGERIQPANYVDRFIFGAMEAKGIPHAPLSGDYEFLRRLSLDLTGRVPSPSQVRDFVADKDPEKRQKAIKRLLNSEEYVEKWAYFYMDLLRANGKMGRGQNLFHYWMKENLRVDRPYDDVVRSLIAASAKSNHVVASSNVIAREHVQGKPQPDDGDDLGMVQQLDTHDELAILYAKTFLGINLSCISCHDGRGHLEKVNVWLSRKKRSEFFRNSSFLGRTRYLMYWEDGKPQSGEFLIDDGNPGYDTKGASMIRVPRFGGPNSAAFILTGEEPKPGAEPREEMGRMLTAHPQFARATVNMFWAKLMGFGVVEPYDEFDLARLDPKNVPEGWEAQASHPELLEALAKDFRTHNYSLRHLLQTICESKAYQLSATFDGEWKESYTKYYARKYVRMLNAEEVHDAIVTVTHRPGKFKYGEHTMPMAMQPSGPSGNGDTRYFMQTFGQSNRSNPPRPPVGSPLQAILLMQSPVVTERVAARDDSRVQQMLSAYQDDGDLVDELFLATLSRPATAEERKTALEALRSDRTRGAENLQWALINQVEFLFNY